MLILRRVRLVNWHYFTDSLIEMGPVTLLGGDNGSGKSTIIDAIQYALVAQVSRIRFNAAASDRRTTRTIESYCRCRIGADSRDYVRGDCISHVILEFGDGEGRFCAGIMVEAFTEGDAREHEWLLEGGKIEDVAIFDGGQFISPRVFRDSVKQLGGYLCATKREYNNRLTHLLGVHRRGVDFNPYLDAVVRSVSFTPFTSVHDFVCNYILEEHNVDVSAMKENLQNYRAAEREALEVERRIQQLAAVEELTEAVAQARRQILRQDYLRLRLHVEDQLLRLGATRGELQRTRLLISNATETLSAEQERKERLDSVRQELQFALASNEQHRAYERLRRDREELGRGAWRMRRNAWSAARCSCGSVARSWAESWELILRRRRTPFRRSSRMRCARKSRADVEIDKTQDGTRGPARRGEGAFQRNPSLPGAHDGAEAGGGKGRHSRRGLCRSAGSDTGASGTTRWRDGSIRSVSMCLFPNRISREHWRSTTACRQKRRVSDCRISPPCRKRMSTQGRWPRLLRQGHRPRAGTPHSSWVTSFARISST